MNSWLTQWYLVTTVDMLVFRFILAVLATWRISHLLTEEDGPWDVIVLLRRMAGDSFLGKFVDCFKCVSLWVAAPFSFFLSNDPSEIVVSWLALSGAAILIEYHCEKLSLIQKETLDDMLWTETSGYKQSSSKEEKPVGCG